MSNTSIDIASHKASLPSNTKSIADLKIERNEVYLFDFDGVVISSDDDDIYHLDSWDGEERLLHDAAVTLSIRCEGLELKYQRHLIYQACALKVGQPMTDGVAISQFLEASRVGYLFILTARSGWYAVERMRRYLFEKDVAPLEIYNVGRVRKDRQIELICREYAGCGITYIEDNISHLSSASAINEANLQLVWAERDVKRRSDLELRDLIIQTIESAI